MDTDPGTVHLVTTRTAAAAPTAARTAADVATEHGAARVAATLGRGATRLDREAAARSRWLTPALSARLAKSSSSAVRKTLAANRATAPATLTKLASDGNRHVRDAALTNPSCPLETVLAAAGDPVGHPDCPPDLLVASLGDRRRDRTRALAHPNLPAAARSYATDSTELWALLENPTTTHAQALEIFDRVADRGLSVAIWKWAEHPAADPAWLAQVAADRFDSADQGTIAHIAQNPATPADVLTRIIDRHAHRDYALENPACPPAAMHASLDKTPEADRGVTAAGYAERSRIIALNPGATLDVLARIPASKVRGSSLFAFVALRGHDADHARAILALADTWTGSLADLLTAAADVVTPAG